jgi:hypothetical protein
MSNNIAVITQDEFEHNLFPNPGLTMALPYLALLVIPQVPQKKLIQRTLWGKVAVPAPEPDFIQVESHYCRSTKVLAHKITITAKPHGNRTKATTNKSRKKTSKPPKVK